MKVASSPPFSFYNVASPILRQIFHSHVIVNTSAYHVLEQFGRRHGLKLLQNQISNLSVTAALFEQNLNNLLSCMRIGHLLSANFQECAIGNLIGTAVWRLFKIFQDFVRQLDSTILVSDVTVRVRTSIHHSIDCDHIGSYVFVAGIVKLLHLLVEIKGTFRLVALDTASVGCV